MVQHKTEKQEKSPLRDHAHESGLSLIGVIISISLALLAIIAYQKSSFNSLSLQREIDFQQSHEDVMGTISNSLVENFNNRMSSSCLIGGVQESFSNLSVGAARLRVEAQINPPAGHHPEYLTNLVRRCQSIQEPPGRSHFHFCLLLDKDSNAPSSSFLGANFAVMEVTITPINLLTNTPLSCSQYASGDAQNFAGLRVFYRSVWGEELGSGPFRYWSRDGHFLGSSRVD